MYNFVQYIVLLLSAYVFVDTDMVAMFEAPPLIPFKTPMDEQKPRIRQGYTGVSGYTSLFEAHPKKSSDMQIENEDGTTTTAAPAPMILTVEEQKKAKHDKMLALNKEKNQLLAADWDPKTAVKESTTENPYLTLFVARLSYDTTAKKLKREFEAFGEVKNVAVVVDLEGKPRGYGFVEYTKEKDMMDAYKKCDGKKIDGRRIIVDVERGRTVRGWLPRRFGGGLGGRKETLSKKAQKEADRKAAIEADLRRSSSGMRFGSAARGAGSSFGSRDAGRGGAPYSGRDRDAGSSYGSRDGGREGDRDGGRGRGGVSSYGPRGGSAPGPRDGGSYYGASGSRDRDRDRDSGGNRDRGGVGYGDRGDIRDNRDRDRDRGAPSGSFRGADRGRGYSSSGHSSRTRSRSRDRDSRSGPRR